MINTKLQAALELAKKGFRVFPLAPNTKLPIKGFDNFSERASTDPKFITKTWTAIPDANIGIATDEFVAVDLDVKKNGAENFARFCGSRALPETVTQETASGGTHLVFQAPHPIANSTGKLAEGVDTRGYHGYIVGAGSTINGKPYKLVRNGKPANAPDWLVEACEKARTEKSRAQEKAATVDQGKARARAEKYLAALPSAEAGARNDAGYKVAAKLKDFGLDRDEACAVMVDHWKCEPALEFSEIAHVVRSAYTYGANPQGSESPEAMFGEAKPGDPSEAEHPFAGLNREYAFVTAGGSHHIVHETTDYKGDYACEHLNEASFHKKLASRFLQTGDGKVMPLTQAWMKSPLRRSYDGFVFLPGKEAPSRFYNFWRGFAAEPLAPGEAPTAGMKEAVRMFEEHIFENVCNEDPEHYTWIMGWLAHIIQKPWEKPLTALVLRGKKGVGKNVIAECIGKLFPPHYMVTGSKRYMTGQFNGHMEKLLLFVLDEAFWSGDKEAEGNLKVLITEPTINVEHKGKEPYKMEARTRFMIFGNENWLVPATHDERRYAVFNVGTGRRQDVKFFRTMLKLMAEGGNRYLLTKLSQFDLSKVDINVIPMTEGLHEQKLQSLTPIQQWWYDGLLTGGLPGIQQFDDLDPDGWALRVPFQVLYDAIITNLKKRGVAKWLPTEREILRIMSEFIPTIDRVKNTVYLPTLETARSQWDRFTGHETAWK